MPPAPAAGRRALSPAGEVGHLRFRVDGLPCRCGNRGCVESCGAWGRITNRYATVVETARLGEVAALVGLERLASRR